MVASFFGLLLTVISNSGKFKTAKASCDERKNEFYNFLQVELLPHLSNSLYDALDRLKANINDFNEKFGTTFSDEEFDTIGGLVLQRFGRVPRRGEEVAMDGYTFKVLRADSRRVYLLEVTPKATISA